MVVHGCFPLSRGLFADLFFVGQSLKKAAQQEAAKTARVLAEHLRDAGRLQEALDVYAQATASLESLN